MGKYFSTEELCKTSVAKDNTPSEEVRTHLEELIEILDNIREEWADFCNYRNIGNPAIRVTSGYRSKAINDAVGGVPNSSHLNGYAVDIVPRNLQLIRLFSFMKRYLVEKDIPFDELIAEKIGGKIKWVHFSIKNNNGEQRKKILEINK